MERLHQVSRLLLILFGTGLHIALAQGYCSLSVRVLSPEQKRLVEVPVSVREKNGRVIEQETKSDDVKFCDLGLTPVTVTVGRHQCNQVTVRDVPVYWNEEYALVVMYDPEPCEKELPPPPLPMCQILLRVSDSSGRWVNNAIVQFQNSGLSTRQTDSAGRALITLKAGDNAQGTVRADGLTPAPFSVACSRPKGDQEEIIRLLAPVGR